jgi:hypothetical protein
MLKAAQIRELRLAAQSGIITKEQFLEFIAQDKPFAPIGKKMSDSTVASDADIQDFITTVPKNTRISTDGLFSLFVEYAKGKNIDLSGKHSLGQKLSKLGVKSKVMHGITPGKAVRGYFFN